MWKVRDGLSEKFQGQRTGGDLGKKRGVSQICTEGMQGESFQSAGASRDKEGRNGGRTQVEH